MVALLYYLPVIFFSKIIPITQSIHNNTEVVLVKNSDDYFEYSVVKTPLGASIYGKVIPIILTVIRLILAIVVQSAINIMIVIEFKKRYSKRVDNRVLVQTAESTIF